MMEMIENQNSRRIRNRLSQSNSDYRYWRAIDRTEAKRRNAREARQRFFRADRQLTRRNLRLAARGNPWLEELEAIEAEREKRWLEELRYFESVKRDRLADRDEEDIIFDDENWQDDRQPLGRLHEDADYLAEEEDARGLKYSYVDTDDNLMH